MKRQSYLTGWTLLLAVTMLGDITSAASAGTGTFMTSVVCLRLPVLVVLILAPADQISNICLAIVDGITPGSLEAFYSTPDETAKDGKDSKGG